MEYKIVPLDQCKTSVLMGHNQHEQSAMTQPGEKPDGIGWYPLPYPILDIDSENNVCSLLWTRNVKFDGDTLVPVVFDPEDTQEIAVA